MDYFAIFSHRRSTLCHCHPMHLYFLFFNVISLPFFLANFICYFNIYFTHGTIVARNNNWSPVNNADAVRCGNSHEAHLNPPNLYLKLSLYRTQNIAHNHISVALVMTRSISVANHCVLCMLYTATSSWERVISHVAMKTTVVEVKFHRHHPSLYYVCVAPPLGTDLLSEWDCLGQCGSGTSDTNKLLCIFVHVSSVYFPSL